MAKADRKKPKAAPRRRRFRLRGFLFNLLKFAIVVGIALPLALTALYKFLPPPGTYLMVQRVFEGKGWDYRWRPLSKISPALVRAAIGAEDAKFCQHKGFDIDAIERAMKNNERRPNRVRGGSTISQQTAKNVFLWPQRSYLRKGLEAYFTVLIETIWGKKRIMEVYLNVAEMGPGIYGAEAASRHYFKKSAKDLTPAQANRLAAILPSPLRYKAATPGPYVRRRASRIGGAAGQVRRDGLAACIYTQT